MSYREAMRKMDQEVLIKKRNEKRLLQYREETRNMDNQFLAAKRKLGSIEEIAKLYLPEYRKEGGRI